MLVACIANPIFINTFVVFVRLFWFEKRFQKIVLEARNFRRTRERSFSREEARAGLEDHVAETGVAGHNIDVVSPGQHTMSVAEEKSPMNDVGKERGGSASSSAEGSSPDPHNVEKDRDDLDMPASFHRDITFADEVKAHSSQEWQPGTMPTQLSPEQHIAFVENQRNPKDDEVLYIPGPRDFDRGDGPHKLEDDNSEEANHHLKWNDNVFQRQSTRDTEHDTNASSSPTTSRRRNLFSRTFSRQNTDKHADEPDSPSLRKRRFSRTLTNILAGSESGDLMPYLSYQPTVGRNSAFVNLTEDQREELGGIEYRSLKTLAIILVCWCLYLLFRWHNTNTHLRLLYRFSHSRNNMLRAMDHYH